jgi:hypothetical protein
MFRRSFSLVAACFLLFGCGDKEEASKFDVLRSKGIDVSAELKRKQSMQAVTVYVNDSRQNWDYETFYSAVSSECSAYVAPQSHVIWDNLPAHPKFCGYNTVTYSSLYLKCVTDTYLAIARGNDVTLKVANAVVKTQDLAVRASIASHSLSSSVMNSLYFLGWLPEQLDYCTDRRAVIAGLVDWVRSVDNLAQLAAKLTVEFSEAERNSTPDKNLAAYRSMSSSLLSRFAASRILVGGSVDEANGEFFSVPGAGVGFCTVPRLSGSAQKALRLIRESAISPDVILASREFKKGIHSEVAIDKFIDAQSLDGGSVRERIASRLGQNIEPGGFLETYGLRENDFAEARRYLASEILAFSRSFEQQTSVVPSQATSSRDGRFASVESSVGAREPSYFSAIARSTRNIAPARSGFDPYSQPLLCGRSSDDYGVGFPVDFVTDDLVNYRRTALDIVDCLINTLPTSNSVAKEDLASLSALAQDFSRTYNGTLEHHAVHVRDNDNEIKIPDCHFEIKKGQIGHGYRIVRGEDALHCYTLGAIEGVPCSEVEKLHQSDWIVAEFGSSNDGHFGAGMRGDCAVEEPQRWYLLKTKGQISAEEIVENGYRSIKVGEWESVLGFAGQTPPPIAPFPSQIGTVIISKKDFPVFRDIEETVSKIMEPDRQWCSVPQEKCLGIGTEDPIPLEDELTDDGSDYEGSWKHYLSLAESAAGESDRLASEYLESGLSVSENTLTVEEKRLAREEKAIASLERVQHICGTSVDPAPLIEALGGGIGEFSFGDSNIGDTCQPTDVQPAGSDFECVAGRLVRSWRKILDVYKYPSLEPLAKCLLGDGSLGAEATYPFTHLGDAGLCVPQDALDGKCGPQGQPSCPDTELAISSSTENSVAVCPNIPGVTFGPVIPAQAGLGFFNSREVVDDTSDAGTACADLRLARRTRDEESFKRLSTSNALSIPTLTALARTIRIEPRVGMFAGVSIGDATWSTGFTETGPNTTSWPCAPSKFRSGCGFFGDGFGCNNFPCTDDSARTVPTHRLMRAALAAKLLFQRGRVTFPIPYYLKWSLPKDSAMDSQTYWRPGGLEPITIASYRNSTWRAYRSDAFTGTDAFGWIDDSYVSPYGPKNWSLKPDVGFGEAVFAFKMEVEEERGAIAEYPRIDANYVPIDFLAGIGNTIGSTTEGCALSALRGSTDPMRPCWQYTATFKAGDLTDSGKDWYEDRDLTPDQYYKDYGGDDLVASDYTYGTSGKFVEMFLDGLELMCMAQESGGAARNGCGGAPPTVNRVADLDNLGSYLDCLGRRISLKGATTIYRDMPKAVVDPFRSNGSGVWDITKGEIGDVLSELRSDLMNSFSIQNSVGHTIRQFGSELKELRAAFKGFAIDGEIEDVEFDSKAIGEMAQCVAASSSIVGVDSVINPGQVGAAAATCANSIAQVGFANKLRNLKKEGIDAAKEQAIARFNGSFDAKAQMVEEKYVELSQVMERINANIGKIASLRSEADKALADALWSMSHEAKSATEVASALSNRKELAFERYTRATNNAKKMAYLAKRAIEQRLGKHFDEMTEDLPLVEAPSTWESRICSMSGVNYEAMIEKEKSTEEISAIADGFVGDYVSKLKNVVESYRLVDGFQDGADTTVISLRDEIFGVKNLCEVDSRNILKSSNNIEVAGVGWNPQREGWYVEGCRKVTNNGVEETVGDCISTSTINEMFQPTGSEESVPVYRIRFGVGSERIQGDSCVDSGETICGWKSDSRLAQRTLLKPGLYALSWYEKIVSGMNNLEPSIVSTAGNVIQSFSPNFAWMEVGENTWWIKYTRFYSVSNEAEYIIGFGGMPSADNSSYVGNAIVAAPMLERFPEVETNRANTLSAGIYESADKNGKTMSRTCADKDGSEFRRRWSRGCLKVCPNGYDSDCSGAVQTSCYHELVFPISQREIESGNQISSGGFAKGSFNYRIRKVGLNAVGTGVRDCSPDVSGQACYGGAFSTYTLLHDGPYYVRNHEGADFEAKLKQGKIEHARALAAERYITNPISSTDRALLGDYMRRELAGRPLDGNFTLRIWDGSGVDFNSIEDIQLVLDYGYWTRQN